MLSLLAQLRRSEAKSSSYFSSCFPIPPLFKPRDANTGVIATCLGHMHQPPPSVYHTPFSIYHPLLRHLRDASSLTSEVVAIYISKAIVSSTYDHRKVKTGHPVRSGVLKHFTGCVVVGWVTTSEFQLLYVLFFLPLLPFVPFSAFVVPAFSSDRVGI